MLPSSTELVRIQPSVPEVAEEALPAPPRAAEVPEEMAVPKPAVPKPAPSSLIDGWPELLCGAIDVESLMHAFPISQD